MSTHARVSNSMYCFLPTEVEGFDSPAELALDLRWSWNHAADEVWQQLDPALWEFTQNPWVVLQTVSRDKLQRMSADPVFRKKVDALMQAKRQAAKAPAWFQQDHPQSPLTRVVYFSMEFMLSEALPIYPGGLGNVAGDQLKAASDLGVPVRQEMKLVRHPAGALDGYVYSSAVSAARPPADYTACVIPHCDGVVIPLEAAQILWQR
jgi:starch phosphorylase